MNIILFPGSFSPFTDGHYGLIARYLQAANDKGLKIDKVKILMSMKEREGINPKVVFKFVSFVYSNDSRIEVVACKQSPVRDVYEEVGDNKNSVNTYIFARSSKDDDKVVEDFYKSFSRGGKYWYEGCKVIDLKVSRDPIVYTSRKDKNNGKPISGTIAREDLKENDLDSFMQSYQIIMKSEQIVTKEHIKKLFEALKRK